jgi:N-acetylglutamate synthase-like GNAT family acetyltransferase
VILNLLEERARAFKIPELFLWTEDKKDFYLNRGYSLVEHREYPQIAIDVLSKKL